MNIQQQIEEKKIISNLAIIINQLDIIINNNILDESKVSSRVRTGRDFVARGRKFLKN